MTGPSNASTQAQQAAIPTVNHRIILAENIRLDDPQLQASITDKTVGVLSRWIKDLIGVDIKPETLNTLLLNLPLTGSVFSAFDVVDDIKTLATYNAGVQKWGYQTLPPWMETGMDLIGILGLPPFKQASMGLKTAIRMTFDPKYVFAHAKDNGAAMITGKTIDMLEDIANTHLKAWQPQLIKGVNHVIGGTITTVEALANMPQARAISSVYTFVTRKKDPAEEIKDLLNDVNNASNTRIKEVVETLIPLILTFTRQHKSPHSTRSKEDLAKIKRKAENESRTKHRNAAPNQVNEHEITQTPGVTTKAPTSGQQSSTAAQDCKSCKTANPVNLATGEEILYQTDFATPGLIPVSWTRCYRSSHAPYDNGMLGARWTSPYTTAITQTAQGLVYHDATGRNVKLPTLGIGELFDNQFEAFTIARTSATEFVIAYPNGSQETYQYDANDNLTAVTDQNGKVTHFGYNGQGLLTTRIDANGNSLTYRYNANLQLLKLLNQNGETYDFAYDAQGRLIREIGFDGKQTVYRYNLAGDLIASESGKIKTEYERDEGGRLLEKRVRRDTGSGPVTEVTRYQYDVLGNLLWIRSKDSEIEFGYDKAGNLVEETQHIRLRQGGKTIERVFTLKHEVDELGNRLETVLPNGRKVTTQRYGSGHWIGTLWNGSPIADIERDDLHREKTRQMGRVTPQRQSRLTQTRHYDPLSRLAGLKLHNGREMVASRSLQYDHAGHLTQVEDWQRNKISYEYDPVGQLLKAVQPGLVETFAFDPAGNLTDGSEQKRQQVNKSGIDHANWDEGLDHLTEQPVNEVRPKIAPVTHNLLKHYLGMQFDYDAEGNTVRKIVKGKENARPYSLNLHYDAENRLIKVVKPQANQTVEAEYLYDAFSRRIAKVVKTLQQAQATGNYGGIGRMETVQEDITFFVWDGDTLIQEIKPDTTITYLYEPDSFVPLAQVHSNTPDSEYDPEHAKRHREADEQKQAAEEQEAERLKWLKVIDKGAYESALKVIEERKQGERQLEFARLEAQALADRIYYINTDHLGTPQEVISEDGKVVWLARYKAWGRVLKLGKEEIRQPFRFQGQYEDEETGLFYNRYRYYDPDSARYLTQDPIGLLGGENTFAYAPNPTAWIDPRGLARKGGASATGGTVKKGSVSCPTACNNPCVGRDPAAAARKWQGPGNDPYLGVDSYTNTVVKKGTVIYTLYPHGDQPGNYFVKSPSVLEAGDARTFNDSVQVAHKGNWNHKKARDMRTQLHAYILGKDTCMAVGKAQHNPNLGSGGGTQYFIENRDKGNLGDTGKIIGFSK